MKFFLRLMVVLSCVGMLVASIFYYLVQKELQAIDSWVLTEPKTLDFKTGSKISTLPKELYNVEFDNFQKYVFKYWLRENKNLTSVKAGVYELPVGSTFKDVLRILVEGKEKTFNITLVEGIKLKDFLNVISKNQIIVHGISKGTTDAELKELIGVKDEYSLEGRLLPDTYKMTYGDIDVNLIKRAFEALNTYLETEYKSRAENLPYKNSYEALIMASIVEKETSIPEERTKVASVFVNRLRLGMKLQTDPTVIYGVGDKYKGKILKSFLEDDNPYNTYIHTGLPPTPIAMPSKESIYAALHPDETNYLYFVAAGPNSREGHVFTTNIKDHENAVKEYRKLVKEYKKKVAEEQKKATEEKKKEEQAKSKKE